MSLAQNEEIYINHLVINKKNLDIIRSASDYSLDEINEDISNIESKEINEDDEYSKYELEFLRSSMNEICSSYVVLSYHMWEKSVLLWCKNRDKKIPRSWKEYERAAKEIYPCGSDLVYVKCLVNVIKHNSKEDAVFITQGRGIWSEIVKIENDCITYSLNKAFINFIFLIIDESGPK